MLIYPSDLKNISNTAKNKFPEIIKKIKDLHFIVFSGTALGLYRDGDLIDTDTDIDFIFYGDSFDIIKERFKDKKIFIERKPFQVAYKMEDIVVDFHFYKDFGDKYLCDHHGGRATIEREQIDNPTIIKTKYGKIPLPNNPEKFFETKYGKDWKIPQYRKKGTYK